MVLQEFWMNKMEIVKIKTFRKKAYRNGVFGMTTHFENPFTLCYTQATSPKKRCGNWGDDLVLSPKTHRKVGTTACFIKHCTGFLTRFFRWEGMQTGKLKVELLMWFKLIRLLRANSDPVQCGSGDVEGMYLRCGEQNRQSWKMN